MRIGIDLLWVRTGICGGTESYIRNLLDGLGQYDKKNRYILFTARDNTDSFIAYDGYDNMVISECPVLCSNQVKRIIWENMHLDKTAVSQRIDLMFIPVYSKPITYGSKIPYVCVIHDLQALHYPEYFSRIRRFYLRILWWIACRTSDKVITISDYCKEDLINRYPYVKNKIQTIYNPVITRDSEMDFQVMEDKYHIKKENYFYCVSAMMPHKNLTTILKVMERLKLKGQDAQLVISGVGGNNQEFCTMLKQLDIEDCVIQTGFVSNEERDCLYENCEMFLFPSIFEGFGMPPIEAMRKGRNVVMTQKSCLWEVTEGKAVYVTDPLDVEEWIQKIEFARRKIPKAEAFKKYELKHIVDQYVEAFSRVRAPK